jgi:parvulin-like peptidyl-prolyl isomerase
MTLSIEIDQIENQTLSQKEAIKKRQLKEETEQQFLNDEGVKVLQDAFNVKADVKSIKPL